MSACAIVGSMSDSHSTFRSPRVHTALLVIVLVVGFGLRMVQPTLVEFKRDEATIARLGQAIAHEGYLPAVGVDSSLGIDNLPLTLYLMALPLRLWSDPVSAVVFTCLLNSLALVGCYLLARAGLGKGPALLATWLFAVSPWAVLYARKIWARTLPLATLAFIIACYGAFVLRKRWALVGAFAALAALVGLQLEALAFVPILGVAMVLYRDAVDRRALLVGLAVLGLLLLPYGIHDARHGWENAQGLLGYAGGDGAFSWDAMRYAFSLLGSKGIEGQAGPFHEQFRRALGPFWWLNDVLSGLLVGGLLYGAYVAVWDRDRARRRTFQLFQLWFWVPIALQLHPSAPTQRHYYVMHYPVQYLLIAAFVTAALRWVMWWGAAPRRRVASSGSTGEELTRGADVSDGAMRRLRAGTELNAVALGLGVVALFGGWQIAVTGHLRRTMVAHPTTGGYGVPLRHKRQAAAAARASAPDGEIVVLAETTQPFLTETPTVFDALLFGVPHRFADGRAALPVPQSEHLAYLVGPVDRTEGVSSRGPDPESGVHPLEVGIARLRARSLMAPGPAVRLSPGGVGAAEAPAAGAIAYETYTWRAANREGVVAGMVPLAQGIPFANNVVFAAFEAPTVVAPGETVTVWLAWWLRAGAPGGADYHFTVQLMDSAGAVVSQHDHAGYPSAMWHAEDLVLSRFVLDIPDGAEGAAYRLRAGMYTYPEIEVVPVVDPAGQPVDDGVTLLADLRVD